MNESMIAIIKEGAKRDAEVYQYQCSLAVLLGDYPMAERFAIRAKKARDTIKSLNLRG